MTKKIFMDKYPIYTATILKSETNYRIIDDISQHIKELIIKHPISNYISTFNHYEHTQNIDGEINADILDAKNIIFCFGKAIPNPQILAVRPRSIGIVELKDSFEFSFLEAPKEELNRVIFDWIKSIKE